MSNLLVRISLRGINNYQYQGIEFARYTNQHVIHCDCITCTELAIKYCEFQRQQVEVQKLDWNLAANGLKDRVRDARAQRNLPHVIGENINE